MQCPAVKMTTIFFFLLVSSKKLGKLDLLNDHCLGLSTTFTQWHWHLFNNCHHVQSGVVVYEPLKDHNDLAVIAVSIIVISRGLPMFARNVGTKKKGKEHHII